MSKTFTIPILLLGALILATYFVLPQYQEFKRVNNQVNQIQTQVLETERYFSNLSQILESLRNYEDSLGKIESALPEDPNLSALLNFFQKKSSENGLLLKNISTAKGGRREVKKGILAKVEETYLNLSLSGPYLSLKGFLETLEKSSRLIEVESISVDVLREGLPEYNLLIKVYSF